MAGSENQIRAGFRSAKPFGLGSAEGSVIPAWNTHPSDFLPFDLRYSRNRDEIDYGATQKAEPFKNPFATVSRKSVANLVAKLATTPGLEIRSSLGVHRAY